MLIFFLHDIGIFCLPNPVMDEDGHYKSFEEVFGTNTGEYLSPSEVESKQKTKSKSLPFNATQQHVKNVNLVIQCGECEMWRIILSKKKLNPQNFILLNRIVEDISYTCGTSLNDLDLPAELESVCIKPHRCYDPMEKLYYSCGFEPICYYCAKDVPEEGQPDEQYPMCHVCQSQGKAVVFRPGRKRLRPHEDQEH